ncbi:hypothetical protein [Alkalicoccus luteus]|uniref:hypothetical protein n=1 Tax=Alkalicoccus luteus TaxID=1237094 RepID=UPI00143BCAB6|nr:hypothetical protein [Alkalicoccus luteus]
MREAHPVLRKDASAASTENRAAGFLISTSCREPFLAVQQAVLFLLGDVEKSTWNKTECVFQNLYETACG